MGKHERMSAERAYELGMITEVVEHDRLLERAHEIADIVNSNAPLAVRGTRLAIHKTLDLPLLEGEILAETFRERVLRTEDAAEGRWPSSRSGPRTGSAADGETPARSRSRPFCWSSTAPTTSPPSRLNRPDRLNSFNRTMCEEMLAAWRIVKLDEATNAVVLRAAGTRAFSAGLDIKSDYGQPDNVWNHEDPGELLSPKWQKMFKPVVCAVQGMCTAGALYFVNEADVVICSKDATFFDSHVSAGLVSALEPIGLMRKVGLGDDAANGVDGQRRTGLRRHRAAYRAGHRESSPPMRCGPARTRSPPTIAAKPPSATQGTVKAIWESLDKPYRAAMDQGLIYTRLGNPLGKAELAAARRCGSPPGRHHGSADAPPARRAHRRRSRAGSRCAGDPVRGPMAFVGRARRTARRSAHLAALTRHGTSPVGHPAAQPARARRGAARRAGRRRHRRGDQSLPRRRAHPSRHRGAATPADHRPPTTRRRSSTVLPGDRRW